MRGRRSSPGASAFGRSLPWRMATGAPPPLRSFLAIARRRDGSSRGARKEKGDAGRAAGKGEVVQGTGMEEEEVRGISGEGR